MTEEAVIRWELDNVSKLNGERRSPISFIAGLPWFVSASKNNAHLGVFLECNVESECDLWRVEHESTVSIIHREEANRQFRSSGAFCPKTRDLGRAKWIDMSTVVDPAKGFIKDDKIILEARITIISTAGVWKPPTFDFKEPVRGWDNVALQIEGERIYVSKTILASHSPVFHAMFFGEFAEKNKEEIKLKDVTREEFIELLHVIYPSQRPITVDSYQFILALADCFQMQTATRQAESYLMKTTMLPIRSKLLLADKYRLELLKIHCMNSFKTAMEVKAIEKTPEYNQLSDTMKASLLAKVFSLLQ